MTHDNRSSPTITEHENEQIERANATGLHAGRVHPRAVAAAEQLGPLGARVFEEAGYTALTPGWPDDPRDRRGGQGAPRGVRAQDRRPGRRPLRRGDRQADEEAGGHRPLVRRAAGADPRRPRPVGGLGGDRPRAVPRRAAAADLRAEVGVAGARQPGQPQPRGAAHLRAVPLRLRQRGQRGRGEGALRHLRRARRRARRSSRPRPRT